MLGKKYLLTAACVYLAYLAHGIQAIIISQLRDEFMVQWSTDISGIFNVIAWTGLGKFLTVWLCGEISDRIGRRPMMLIGSIGYLLFFTLLIYTQNYLFACISAFLGGAATSFFDGGAYPALQESFPKAPASALILIKGFISISGIFYPLFLAVILGNSSYQWTVGLWIPLAISVLVFVFACIAPFSYDAALKQKKRDGDKGKQQVVADASIQLARARFIKQPSFAIEGVCCLAYGFICMMTFYLIQQCITIYGRDVIGMSDIASRALMSYYTVGSLIAVLLGSVIMAMRVKVISLLVIYTFGSLISMLLMCFIQTPLVTAITSFTIGFFAAGGVLQSGVALIGEYFPSKKGRNLGIYYTFMGLASYVGPVICAKLIDATTAGLEKGTPKYVAAEVLGKIHIMYFDLVIAAIGFGLMAVLALRYKSIFGNSPFARESIKAK